MLSTEVKKVLEGEIEEVKKTISGLFDKLHEAEQNGQVEELKIELETVKKEKEEQISALQQTNERLQMTEHQLQVLKEENARLGEACDDADAIEQGLRDEIFELKQQLAKLQAEKDGEDTREVNRRMGNIEAPAGHSTKACEKEMRSDSPCSAVSSFEKLELSENSGDVPTEKEEPTERTSHSSIKNSLKKNADNGECRTS
ncbi:unnamed protein product [Gongylonema pulchrum]|uniref:Uncharacterized protein n=1 Tax=Gongylonema pulchrum TaxID=637853 RepID=A0A3P6QWC4_9BILA|nr:unnamed protein product [Gongylonema pulchrum]